MSAGQTNERRQSQDCCGCGLRQQPLQALMHCVNQQCLVHEMSQHASVLVCGDSQLQSFPSLGLCSDVLKQDVWCVITKSHLPVHHWTYVQLTCHACRRLSSKPTSKRRRREAEGLGPHREGCTQMLSMECDKSQHIRQHAGQKVSTGGCGYSQGMIKE